MKGIIQPPKEPLINISEVDIDLLVTYLSGGGASNAPVKLRSQIQQKYAHFEDYEDFTFANGEIKEEITRRSDFEYTQEQQIKKGQPKIQTSELILDNKGSSRTKITGLPSITAPQDILTEDETKNISIAHRDVWIAGKGAWWFDVSGSDRIDLLPEKKRYEPGETAKFQAAFCCLHHFKRFFIWKYDYLNFCSFWEWKLW